MKVLHGDFKLNPQRRNQNEPIVAGEIVQPALSPPAQENWNYLVPILTRSRMLTAADVFVLAEFCEAVVIVRLARLALMKVATGRAETVPGAPSPYTNYSKMVNVMTSLGSRLGLSPSDRARLEVGPIGADVDPLISGL